MTNVFDAHPLPDLGSPVAPGALPAGWPDPAEPIDDVDTLAELYHAALTHPRRMHPSVDAWLAEVELAYDPEQVLASVADNPDAVLRAVLLSVSKAFQDEQMGLLFPKMDPDLHRNLSAEIRRGVLRPAGAEGPLPLDASVTAARAKLAHWAVVSKKPSRTFRAVPQARNALRALSSSVPLLDKTLDAALEGDLALVADLEHRMGLLVDKLHAQAGAGGRPVSR